MKHIALDLVKGRLAKSRLSASRVLLWYMRALSVYYFVSGLKHWGAILGISADFATLPPHWQAAHIYFAILELAASLGLWFGAAWGVAAWLFCAVAELVMMNGFSELFPQNWLTTIFHVVTIVGYLVLAWWSGSPENTSDVLRFPEE